MLCYNYSFILSKNSYISIAYNYYSFIISVLFLSFNHTCMSNSCMHIGIIIYACGAFGMRDEFLYQWLRVQYGISKQHHIMYRAVLE